MKTQQGFTILEISIAIMILTIISSLIVVALNPLRESNRNYKRVADIKTMQTALAMFYRDWSDYPALVTPGQALVSDSVTYLLQWPQNPTPRADGSCADSEYSYLRIPSSTAGSASYSIGFCLSAPVEQIGVGTSYAIPGQIVTCLANCVKSCNTDGSTGANGCGGVCANATVCATGETCVSDHCVPD